jgi:hypothetical protein
MDNSADQHSHLFTPWHIPSINSKHHWLHDKGGGKRKKESHDRMGAARVIQSSPALNGSIIFSRAHGDLSNRKSKIQSPKISRLPHLCGYFFFCFLFLHFSRTDPLSRRTRELHSLLEVSRILDWAFNRSLRYVFLRFDTSCWISDYGSIPR